MSSKKTRRIAKITATVAIAAAAVVIAHVTHHLDWTTLPVIGPQGITIGQLHIFIH